jgi:hypothetical protein
VRDMIVRSYAICLPVYALLLIVGVPTIIAAAFFVVALVDVAWLTVAANRLERRPQPTPRP